ncbi:hypothetical protein PHK61_15235 [Actinomycetospora lutea]|uniref:hypothetical protein n=1 Tax=Actinomycetospora lutea TaxID=663604 RepID=UPI002366CA06|nr:hypothetical protein [Actinomycetospora lutea]MDD7939775.1 hypothetical protein [Actinomycetospora lutea]
MIGDRKIEGKVARVLNERELVVNRGADHGVTEGMFLEVVDRDPEDILDPETGEVIGQVSPVKNYVKVTEVQAKMSVAATYLSWKTAGGALSSLSVLPNLFAPSRTEYDVIETDEPSLGDDRDTTVHVGDVVRESRDLPS